MKPIKSIKNLIVVSLLGLFFSACGTLFDDHVAIIKVPVDILVKIEGPIKLLDKEAKHLTLLSKTEDKVYVTIDSLGGKVVGGYQFIEAITAAKDRGTKIICIVTGTAHSAASSIFSHCSDRYAFPAATIMWHSAAYPALEIMDEGRAKEIYESLRADNIRLYALLRKYFQPSYFDKHFKAETIIPAKELIRYGPGFLKLVDRIVYE